MSQDVHKAGTDDGWHGVIKKGGQFEPEKDRYHLYISEPIIDQTQWLSRLVTS